MARKKTKKRAAKVAKKATKRVARKKIAKRARRKAVTAASAAGKAKKTRRAAARRTKDIPGEGNYTASRRFREREEDFVKANKSRIPEMGKEAEAALEGPQGAELAMAEDQARAHARG